MITETKIIKYNSTSKRNIVKKYTIAFPFSVKKCLKPLVFIHGGAWRDPANTYKDFDKLVSFIDKKLNNNDPFIGVDDVLELDCYSIDYRLSSEVKHPGHLIDVLEALEFIKTDVTSNDGVVLCGHSVGATLITQILEYRVLLAQLNINRSFNPVKFSSAVFLDGIYDVTDMLKEYPSYKFFIDETFDNDKDAFENCNFVPFTDDRVVKIYGELEKLIIIHSIKDELLSLRQPERFINWLCQVNGLNRSKIEYIVEDFGQHNDVYQNEKVANLLCREFL